MKYQLIKRKDLVIGDVYYDSEIKSIQSKFVYIGKFPNDKSEKDCLYFYPIINNNYGVDADKTVAFVDSPSFSMYEEI